MASRFHTWFCGTLAVVLLFTLVGCNSGGRSSGGAGGSSVSIPGLNQAAVHLPDDNRTYVTGEMETPRYSHTATSLPDGRVLITGGSDERHLTSLDTAEIYDQTVFDEPQPESVSGGWVDTDFAGDPMVMKTRESSFRGREIKPGGLMDRH